jgi:hypothetical protein
LLSLLLQAGAGLVADSVPESGFVVFKYVPQECHFLPMAGGVSAMA